MINKKMFLLLLAVPALAIAQEAGGAEELVSGMQWVSFLTPVIVFAATFVTKKLISKLPPIATLMIVASFSTVTGWLMQLGEQTDNWMLTALVGLGSVFLNELKKGFGASKK